MWSYGWGTKRQEEEEYDKMFGDVIYVSGGFGAGPQFPYPESGEGVDTRTHFTMNMLWTEIKKG